MQTEWIPRVTHLWYELQEFDTCIRYIETGYCVLVWCRLLLFAYSIRTS